MFENKRDGCGIEAYIQRIKNAPHHGDAEMCFHHGGNIRKHCSNGFAGLEPVTFQGACELSGPGIGLRPGVPDIAMNDGNAVGVGRS